MANSKYWSAICYPENMVDNWKLEIGDILQLPYSYCVHDQDHCLGDLDELRKEHVHIMIAFANTTTHAHALRTMLSLSRDGSKCCSTIENVNNVRHMYNYLIHDTETCRKKGKFLYSASDRISGNNFDIGSFEQLSAKEKEDMAMELCDVIINEKYTNFMDFFVYVRQNFTSEYFQVIKSHSGLFERLTRGNFQKYIKYR